MKIAACLYVRNEKHDIIEWIVHHVSIGFDTIFVMDNNSDDDTASVARSAARFHDVRVGVWPETGLLSQRRCYTTLLKDNAREFDWMAFIDADEFIMPLKDRNIKIFLSRFQNHAAVALNWAVFGSSGFRRAPKGLVLELYTLRSDEHFYSNRHIKSIVRPAYTDCAVNPHVFSFSDTYKATGRLRGSGYVNAAGEPVVWSEQVGITDRDPDLTICRINHYYTRSRQHFDEKIKRKTWRDPHRALEEFEYNDRTEVTDNSAQPFAWDVHALADRIRPSVKFTPAKYGSLPTEAFGPVWRDYVEPEHTASEPVVFRDLMKEGLV